MTAALPLIELILLLRVKKNKEDFSRLNERRGISLTPRPDGRLIWLHASSVGESMAALSLITRLLEIEKEGKVLIKTPCQLDAIEGEENIKSITLKFDDGKVEKINTDIVLSFFGLIMKLGPIAEWGLNMDKKTIEVNSENFETNKKGIFAIGDICSYPGKLKLILPASANCKISFLLPSHLIVKLLSQLKSASES